MLLNWRWCSWTILILDRIPTSSKTLHSCGARIFNLILGSRGAEKAAEQQVAGLGVAEIALLWKNSWCMFDRYI